MSVRRQLFIIACFSLIFSVNAIAQEEPETLPDNPLYQAKRQMETAKLNAQLDPLGKAELHTKYAEERLEEVKAMISKAKPDFVEGLLEDYGKAIDYAMDEIKKATSQDRDASKALEAVEKSTKKHTEVLTGLLEKVPEQAKPAISHAIEVSKQGRNRALDVLNKIQRGEIPIGKSLKGVGKPEGVGKIEHEHMGKPKETERSKEVPVGQPAGRGRKRQDLIAHHAAKLIVRGEFFAPKVAAKPNLGYLGLGEKISLDKPQKKCIIYFVVNEGR